MTTNKKRTLVLAIIVGVIALGFVVGPLILNKFLEMHGL